MSIVRVMNAQYDFSLTPNPIFFELDLFFQMDSTFKLIDVRCELNVSILQPHLADDSNSG